MAIEDYDVTTDGDTLVFETPLGTARLELADTVPDEKMPNSEWKEMGLTDQWLALLDDVQTAFDWYQRGEL